MRIKVANGDEKKSGVPQIHSRHISTKSSKHGPVAFSEMEI